MSHFQLMTKSHTEDLQTLTQHHLRQLTKLPVATRCTLWINRSPILPLSLPCGLPVPPCIYTSIPFPLYLPPIPSISLPPSLRLTYLLPPTPSLPPTCSLSLPLCISTSLPLFPTCNYLPPSPLFPG